MRKLRVAPGSSLILTWRRSSSLSPTINGLNFGMTQMLRLPASTHLSASDALYFPARACPTLSINSETVNGFCRNSTSGGSSLVAFSFSSE